MIYLDHAATTPIRSEVISAMAPYLNEKYANASGSYAAARASRKAIDASRSEIAGCLGAKKNEIFFTSGGSEADNWAIIGTALAHPEKKHIITSDIEHHAVLNTCKAMERFGYDVTYLHADSMGRISPDDAEAAFRPDTVMISVMLANNEIGTIEPISRIADKAKKKGILMHTDAVQAIGHIPVDVSILGVDLLSLSSHKFYGPKGIGALYIRDGVRIERMIHGGDQERSLRAGTENTAGIVGMSTALRLSCKELQQEANRLTELRNRLESLVSGIPGVHVNGIGTDRLPGHVHLTIDDANTSLLIMQLDMMGIAVSGGSACASGAQERSHVMRAIGYRQENQADIRLTLGKNSSESEVDTAAAALRRCLKR